MSKFIEAALSNKDITIYGDGSQTRTFCYVDDNVEACLNAFYTHRFVNDVINVGNDHETSILELAQLIKKILNSKSNIVHLPALKEGDMTRRCPDIGKMKILLNRELTPLEIGMERVIEVFRNKKGK